MPITPISYHPPAHNTTLIDPASLNDAPAPLGAQVKLVKHTETGELFAMKVFSKAILKKKRMGSKCDPSLLLLYYSRA